jgi:hypothetical protein
MHHTRSTSGIHVPPRERLNLHVSVNRYSPVPSSARAALKDPNWLEAMTEDYHALLGNDTWNLVPPPQNANIISGKWVFRHKLKPDGSLDRYKAHWVLRDDPQV